MVRVWLTWKISKNPPYTALSLNLATNPYKWKYKKCIKIICTYHPKDILCIKIMDLHFGIPEKKDGIKISDLI